MEGVKVRWILILLGFLMVGSVVVAAAGPPQDWRWLVRKVGPPEVEMEEVYADAEGLQRMAHGALTELLRRHVRDGLVDYAALKRDEALLDAYLQSVAEAPFDALSRDGRLALLINAYNAATLKLMVEHWPVASIRDIPADERWEDERWLVGGRLLSLDGIENRYLRRRFVEPRIHFAINCASVGCPPLRSEAYEEEHLEAQLDDQARRVHRDGSAWVEVKPDALHLSRIYLWYEPDFVRVAGSVQNYVARYRPEVAGRDLPIVWLPYDWAVNKSR